MIKLSKNQISKLESGKTITMKITPAKYLLHNSQQSTQPEIDGGTFKPLKMLGIKKSFDKGLKKAGIKKSVYKVADAVKQNMKNQAQEFLSQYMSNLALQNPEYADVINTANDEANNKISGLGVYDNSPFPVRNKFPSALNTMAKTLDKDIFTGHQTIKGRSFRPLGQVSGTSFLPMGQGIKKRGRPRKK